MADGILRYCIMMAMLVVSVAIMACIGLVAKAGIDPTVDWITSRFGVTPVFVACVLAWAVGAYLLWVRPRFRQ